MERFKPLKFLLLIFVDPNNESYQALGRLDDWLELEELVVVELHQAFECGNRELANAVHVIVVLVFYHVVQVVDDVVKLLEGAVVVAQLEVGLAASLLKPDALVVVDGGLVAAVFEKDFYNIASLLDLAGLGSVDC